MQAPSHYTRFGLLLRTTHLLISTPGTVLHNDKLCSTLLSVVIRSSIMCTVSFILAGRLLETAQYGIITCALNHLDTELYSIPGAETPFLPAARWCSKLNSNVCSHLSEHASSASLSRFYNLAILILGFEKHFSQVSPTYTLFLKRRDGLEYFDSVLVFLLLSIIMDHQFSRSGSYQPRYDVTVFCIVRLDSSLLV